MDEVAAQIKYRTVFPHQVTHTADGLISLLTRLGNQHCCKKGCFVQ